MKQSWRTAKYGVFILSLCHMLSLAPPLFAAPSMAMGYTPKYPADFSHFDYVNPNAPVGGDLILHGFGNFDTFNLFTLKGVKADGLSELVFETLMVGSLDEPYSLYGHLADDVVMSEDRSRLRFHIDPRARFSDGSRVTAEDVSFSFNTIREKGHPFYRFVWADIKEARVLNKAEIEFTLSKDYPELPMIAAQIPVFAKKWIAGKEFEKVSRDLPIGSGPYTIESYRLGKDIIYRKNPNYWARDKATAKGMYNFERIIYKYYKDETVRLEALKAGEFYFLHENYSKLWAREHNGPKYDSGAIIKMNFPHHNNAGMQGFFFNTRRQLFKDVRVRRAISLAYDFEWANKNLFYNQYVRCDSYFSNSDMAATGLPEGLELDILKNMQSRFPGRIASGVFNQVWKPSQIHDQTSLRASLREAKHLLDQAGWKISDGVLKKEGVALEFEVLLAGKGFERILDAFSHNLRKLGIVLRYRTVDVSLWVRRAREFDFDMIVSTLPEGQMPGKEIGNYWSSTAADQQGSRNYAGIKDPVIDALIVDIVNSRDRDYRVAAIRALDRILLHGEYLVPNWYINYHRVAFWDRFNYPKTFPLYYQPTDWAIATWWTKPEILHQGRAE